MHNNSLTEIKNRNFLELENIQSKSVTSSNLLFGTNIKRLIKLSIVIPTFGRLSSLKKSILSILNQSRLIPLEIVIVDNNPKHIQGSNVFTMIEEINDARIVYYCNDENLGPMGNWNRGFMLAKGEWICMVHDDDYVHPHWLEYMETTLERMKGNCDILACKYFTINKEHTENDFLLVKHKKPSPRRIQVVDMFNMFCAPLLGSWIKKDFFRCIGSFAENHTKFEDYIFMTKAVYYGDVYCISNKLYGYVVGATNDSNNTELWDDIIIGEYYFRKSILDNWRVGIRMNKLTCDIKVIKSIIAHKHPRLKMTNFYYVPVDERYIIRNCNISEVKYSAIYNYQIVLSYSSFYIKKIIKWLFHR